MEGAGRVPRVLGALIAEHEATVEHFAGMG